MFVPVHKGIDTTIMQSELRELGVWADTDARDESLSK